MDTFSFDAMQCICGYFNSDIVFPGMSQSPKRIVDEYEIEIYPEDCGITYLGDQPIPIHRGMILFAMPGTERYSELPIKNYYLKVPEQNSPITDLLKSMPTWFDSASVDFYASCINQMLSAIIKGDMWLKSAGMLQLLSYLQKEKEQIQSIGTASPKEITVVNDAIRYMKENFSKKCTLEEIAGFVHLSPFYFHSIFRKIKKTTPQKYLTEIRIEKASELLITTDMEIASIADQCGFSSQAYFTDVFRTHTNMTPRMYRIKMMKKYIR